MITAFSKGFFQNNLYGTGANLAFGAYSTFDNAKLLNNMTTESRSILFEFQTTFPFDFFPDKIIIDANKVNIVSQDFFFCSHMRSILISDISDVSIDTGVFFATVSIIDSSNYRFPIIERMKYVTKSDAIMARKLIQGLIMAKSRNINLSNLPVSQVRKEMCTLGEG